MTNITVKCDRCGKTMKRCNVPKEDVDRVEMELIQIHVIEGCRK
jgi:hypothetical protein